ncbi:toll/interleukin-1 receptor domain-containing protein (plasmid) [Cupriavidus oxalaticus]|uniref:Toll/interleukin-1 receptor domain-containing protein n=1 Tax=Cupriavidus oxalaticus TaxID=96344 RepID=A0A5P3VSL3_9BURK|nr:toll/interleukin-1 receptor domain-containing protein [Cupriavidus oxalaticus]
MAVFGSDILTISQHNLRRAAIGSLGASRSKGYGQKSAFLCHSHKDRDLALGLAVLMKNAGVDLYIDWLDESMPARPSRTTAEQLKLRIFAADWFLFLATENSTASRWCPWELGYADGKKALSRIAVVPTSNSTGTTFGSEYLDLYRRIDVSAVGELIAVEPSQSYGTPVRQVF